MKDYHHTEDYDRDNDDYLYLLEVFNYRKVPHPGIPTFYGVSFAHTYGVTVGHRPHPRLVLEDMGNHNFYSLLNDNTMQFDKDIIPLKNLISIASQVSTWTYTA